MAFVSYHSDWDYHPDIQYLKRAEEILEYGEVRDDRTGTGVISLFAPAPMRFDLEKGFPLLTTKKIYWKGVVHELLWFLQGNTNVKYLIDNNVNIWTDDAYRWFKQNNPNTTITKERYIEIIKAWHTDRINIGDLGRIYGYQWTKWGGYINQIENLIKSLKENPTSRRHVVSAWNVGDLDKMALPPCHVLFQAYVSNDGGLSLQMYQR